LKNSLESDKPCQFVPLLQLPTEHVTSAGPPATPPLRLDPDHWRAPNREREIRPATKTERSGHEKERSGSLWPDLCQHSLVHPPTVGDRCWFHARVSRIRGRRSTNRRVLRAWDTGKRCWAIVDLGSDQVPADSDLHACHC
jgi:hypothetical protein